MKWELADKALHSDFLRTVEELSEQNLSSCYQCGKCSGGCPISAELDLSPNRLLRMVQLGLEDEVLGSETVWCCAACGTCTGRCPMNIDLGRVMDVLRGLALRRQVAPPPTAAPVLTFYRSFLDAVRRFGRLTEVGLMGSYNMNSGRVFTNMDKAPWFLIKRKISFSPHKISRIDRLERVFRRIEEIEGT